MVAEEAPVDGEAVTTEVEETWVVATLVVAAAVVVVLAAAISAMEIWEVVVVVDLVQATTNLRVAAKWAAVVDGATEEASTIAPELAVVVIGAAGEAEEAAGVAAVAAAVVVAVVALAVEGTAIAGETEGVEE